MVIILTKRKHVMKYVLILLVEKHVNCQKFLVHVKVITQDLDMTLNLKHANNLFMADVLATTTR